MDYFELVKISSQNLEVTNPAAPEKLLTIGHNLNLNAELKVIDFGCGYGRTLALWSEDFGVSGLGVEIHPYLCKRAAERMEQSDLSKQIKISCCNPLDYQPDGNTYDIVICLGASFVWGGYLNALQRMKKSLKAKGKIVIGERYYTKEDVPGELVKFEGDLNNEFELMGFTRDKGFDVEFALHASRDDWDRYVSSVWYGLIQWIDSNQDHPERQYVIDYLHKRQDMYFRYQREYEGWVMYILNQKQY